MVGLMRNTVCVGGTALSLMIWVAGKGFGRPYDPGSTDIGAAVIYARVFSALLEVDAFGGPSPSSIDVLMERRIPF